MVLVQNLSWDEVSIKEEVITAVPLAIAGGRFFLK